MLEIRNLCSGYGETQILYGLDLALPAGQFLALLGRNGVGKTTSLRTIMGLNPVQAGMILLAGKPLIGLPPYEIARHGVGYVSETRDIFPSLTVRENLLLAAQLGAKTADSCITIPWTLERILDFFPALQPRLNHGGMQLSGGEQQMLAISRALLTNPGLLLLDEPTEGLAPIIIAQIREKLAMLKQSGLTLLLVEQNIGFALSLADQICILGRGQIMWQGSAAQFQENRAVQAQWLGI